MAQLRAVSSFSGPPPDTEKRRSQPNGASGYVRRARSSPGSASTVDDNEPGAFSYHLARSLESAAPSLGRDALELLRASSLIPARNVISSLLNAVSEADSETYLFLDDFHVVADPRCNELMTMLVRYAPSNLHLVLVSRTEPRLSLSRLRLEDELVEVDASLLKFTVQEMADFLGEVLVSRLGRAGVAKLHAATEGWPAALQLSRISLMNSPDALAHVRTITGTSRTISEYFEDTLATEPPAVVDFLLKTSILGQMNGSLCSAVAGTADGASILEALEREQFLLVPLDEHGHWYRYHHLLREFLVDRLRTKKGEEVDELHRRAYRWYAAREMWSEAVHYAIAAGRLPTGHRVHRELRYVDGGQGRSAHAPELGAAAAEGADELPARGQAGPRLGHEPRHPLQGGGCSHLAGRGRSAGDARQRSVVAVPCRAGGFLRPHRRQRPRQGHRLGMPRRPPVRRLQLQRALQRGALCLPKVRGLERVLRGSEARTSSAGEASYLLPENYRLCLNGLAAVKQLKFEEALEFYAAAQALTEKYAGAKSIPASMLTGLIARLQYERGDVTGAEVMVLDALDLIETTAFHEGFRNAYFVLVRAAAIRGDRARAVSLLNRAERLSWERGWGVVIAMLLVERTRLLLADGNIAEAIALQPAFEELHAKHPAGVSCSSTPIRTWNMVSKGLIDAATDNLEDAANSLSQAFEGLLATDDRFIALRVGIDLAVLHARLGSSAKAHDLLRQLMSWGAEANMPSFVLDHDRRIVPILVQARDQGVFDDHGRAP